MFNFLFLPYVYIGQTRNPDWDTAFFPEQVVGVLLFLCHTEIRETFLNVATDHSLVSRNSDSPKRISRGGGVKKHQSCGQTSGKVKLQNASPLEAFMLLTAGSDL